jgi:hypothetical protein
MREEGDGFDADEKLKEGARELVDFNSGMPEFLEKSF